MRSNARYAYVHRVNAKRHRLCLPQGPWLI